jgi:hypothetical protein
VKGNTGSRGPAGPLITTYGAVGTYVYGRPKNRTWYHGGETASGVYAVCSGSYILNQANSVWANYSGQFPLYKRMSGTWRCTSTAGLNLLGLWIRIS